MRPTEPELARRLGEAVVALLDAGTSASCSGSRITGEPRANRAMNEQPLLTPGPVARRDAGCHGHIHLFRRHRPRGGEAQRLRGDRRPGRCRGRRRPFLWKLLDDHVLGPFFPGGVGVRYRAYVVTIPVALGGPERYRGDMVGADCGLGISDAHCDRTAAHLGATLDELGIPGDLTDCIIAIAAVLRPDEWASEV